MPSVSRSDSPPSSPRSPPRKKTRFSLKLKSKKKASSESDPDKREKLYPIFSPPTAQNTSDDETCEPPKPPPPYAGLRNHGNICYANAVVQVLRHCPGILESVDELDSLVKDKNDCATEGKSFDTRTDGKENGSEDLENCCDQKHVVCELRELFSQMEELEQDYNDNKENCEHLVQRRNTLVLAAKPLDFMQTFRGKNPLFEDNLQHDAQEFLCSLLVDLQDTETEIKKKREDPRKMCIGHRHVKNSPSANSCTNNTNQCHSSFEDLFQGCLLHQTKCMTCEDAKKRFESFLDISVPVQDEPKVRDLKAFSPTPKKGRDTQSLAWALSQFATVEHLSGDNKYFCENCLTLTEAEISTSFDKLPRILTIHLKRFTANQLSGFSGMVSKITSNLETPMELSVKEWCSKTCSVANPTYHLFGIVMHSGMTSCSGHYQAYVKVTTPTNADVNNNKGQPIHPDNKYHVNNGYVHRNMVSSGEFDWSQMPASEVNRTSDGCDTLASDSKLLENMEMTNPENDINALQSPAGKGTTTCMSGISRYFQRSRKHSVKETNEQLEQNGDLPTAGKKQTHHVTPTHSLKKIQSFGYRGGKTNRGAIRQLNFQENKQDNKLQNTVSIKESSNSIEQSLQLEKSQWIHFDDAEVMILEESDLTAMLSSAESSFTSPYLLFYKLAEQ